MENMNYFRNHLGSSTISIHIICVIPCCAKQGGKVLEHSQAISNHRVVHKVSSQTPKKIVKKISKAIVPYMCVKTRQQDESPSYNNAKKITKKFSNATQYLCLKTKQQDDDKCLWKKAILMGEKCQPLEFSGAIFYDSDGNQLSEPPTPRTPKTPRTSPFL